jgi:hypothetical protein
MEEEALKREEEKMRVGTRLQVARGLGSLGQGAYEKAARELLGVKGDLGDWGKTVSQLFVFSFLEETSIADLHLPPLSSLHPQVISPAELAIIAALCALATLRRSALKSELLFNDGFRAFVDEEPHVRELVDSFVEGKYKKTLEMLEKHSVRSIVLLCPRFSLSSPDALLPFCSCWYWVGVAVATSLDPVPHAASGQPDELNPPSGFDPVLQALPGCPAGQDGGGVWAGRGGLAGRCCGLDSERRD